jgi:hypothetical protein
MNRPRQQYFGSKQPSVASRRAAVISLLVTARVLPTVETLVRSYGLRVPEAERMLAEEQRKRSMSI